jgi:hypothetical protein
VGGLSFLDKESKLPVNLLVLVAHDRVDLGKKNPIIAKRNYTNSMI